MSTATKLNRKQWLGMCIMLAWVFALPLILTALALSTGTRNTWVLSLGGTGTLVFTMLGAIVARILILSDDRDLLRRAEAAEERAQRLRDENAALRARIRDLEQRTRHNDWDEPHIGIRGAADQGPRRLRANWYD